MIAALGSCEESARPCLCAKDGRWALIERDERLTALEGLKRNGVLDEKEFLEKRKEVVHGETESE